MFHVEQGEGANSLSQNLTVLPAPSEREPLALPEALHFSQKPSRHAKGPISEGAVCAADWGSSGRYPLRLTMFASSPKGTPLRYAGNFIATAKSRPLGDGGIAVGDDGRGNLRSGALCTSARNFPAMPKAPSPRGLSAQQTGGVLADTPSGAPAPAPPRGRLCAMPETLSPPPKAVPLGKVAATNGSRRKG